MGFSHLKIKIMTKRYELIHLNGQMYMVDKGKPILHDFTDGWYVIEGNEIWPIKLWKWSDNVGNFETKDGAPCQYSGSTFFKVVATTDPSLGLPLLPDIEEDVASMLLKRLAELGFPKMKTEEIHNWSSQIVAAKAKQYTKEDMWDAARFGYDTANNNADDEGTQMTGEEFQAFLQKLRPLPIAVEVEMVYPTRGKVEEALKDNPNWIVNGINTIDIELKPVVENGYVKVRRWIYE
jgi:hypothetical protein